MDKNWQPHLPMSSIHGTRAGVRASLGSGSHLETAFQNQQWAFWERNRALPILVTIQYLQLGVLVSFSSKTFRPAASKTGFISRKPHCVKPNFCGSLQEEDNSFSVFYRNLPSIENDRNDMNSFPPGLSSNQITSCQSGTLHAKINVKMSSFQERMDKVLTILDGNLQCKFGKNIFFQTLRILTSYATSHFALGHVHISVRITLRPKKCWKANAEGL